MNEERLRDIEFRLNCLNDYIEDMYDDGYISEGVYQSVRKTLEDMDVPSLIAEIKKLQANKD